MVQSSLRAREGCRVIACADNEGIPVVSSLLLEVLLLEGCRRSSHMHPVMTTPGEMIIHPLSEEMCDSDGGPGSDNTSYGRTVQEHAHELVKLEERSID
eukprot:2971488-Amphidinium_carterae.2